MLTAAKYMSRITLLIALSVSSASAFASGVFKCVDADGTTTFSFTSCPSIAAPIVSQNETTSDKPRRTELANLNASISSIQSELDSLKKNYEQSLSAPHRDGRSDELTHSFDIRSHELFKELARLQLQKAKLDR